MEIDPVGLVRNRRGPSGEGGTLDRYVNDRPYAASSFLSVAIAEVFRTALAGRCNDRPELVDRPGHAFCRSVPGGRGIFAQIVRAAGLEGFCEAAAGRRTVSRLGDSLYFGVELTGTLPLHLALSHLYVLVPVLDNDKHYWVGDDEVEKLLRHGEGWLGAHPERELITTRYLKYRRKLIDDAISRLADEDDPSPDETAEISSREEEAVERAISLNEQRLGTVLAVLKSTGARTVLAFLGRARWRVRIGKEHVCEAAFCAYGGAFVGFLSGARFG